MVVALMVLTCLGRVLRVLKELIDVVEAVEGTTYWLDPYGILSQLSVFMPSALPFFTEILLNF